MPAITIRNVPEGLLEKLKRRAKDQRRSVNNEIIKILEDAEAKHKSHAVVEFLSKNEFDDDVINKVEEAYQSRS